MVAIDQAATSVSPCSPMMCAWTLRASTPKCWLRSERKRAVSRMVPEPITRSGGSADRGECRPCQHVDGIGGHQQDCIRCPLQYLRHDLAKDGGIPPEQFQARFSGPLVCSRSEDHHRRARDIVVGACPDAHRIRKRHGVHQVHGFALGTT